MGGCSSHQLETNRVYSVPLQGTKTQGFSQIYRNAQYPDRLYGTPDEKIKTMRDVVLASRQKFKNNNHIGQVVIKGTDKDGKDERQLIKFTYQQMFEMSNHLGSHILNKKLEYKEDIFGMKIVGIYAKNRYEWIAADIACTLYGLTLVPLYDTLGIQNLTHCLQNSGMETCFVTESTIQTLLKLKGHGNLKTVISFDYLSSDVQSSLKNAGFNLLYFSQMIKQPDKLIDFNQINIKTDDCLTFSYTSGTTGPPKGAMLSHGNFLAFLAAFHNHDIKQFKTNDIYVSFLPLPHVFQRVIQASIMYFGAFAVFFNGDVTKLKDDCNFIKPTIFIGVPRIFNKIHEGVQGQFREAGGIAKCLVTNGMKSKTQNLQENGDYSSGFYDKVVFSKVRAKFGGKVRLMITGSAPIRPQVFEFMKIVMCCPFYQGYGQTQNTAAAFITPTYDNKMGHVGGVVTDLQFKLSDIPQMYYTSEDKDDQGRHTPRGEIWLRGPAVFLGYYKQQDKTKETITPDGWLKTGDVGMLLPGSNAMKIIDRKKNIFKLQQGQYVAAEKVEAIYSKSHLITEVFLHGQSTQIFCVAIIVPQKTQIEKIAKDNNIEGTYEQICNNKKMKNLVCRQLNSIGKKEGLNGFQQAKNIYIETKPFVDKKILTNTLKLQRFAAKKQYAKQIQQMYKQGQLDIK